MHDEMRFVVRAPTSAGLRQYDMDGGAVPRAGHIHPVHTVAGGAAYLDLAPVPGGHLDQSRTR